MSSSSVTITRKSYNGGLERLKKAYAGKMPSLHIGIMDAKAKAPVHGTTRFNMAGLGRLLEYGSSDGHIPARPHLLPAVEDKSAQRLAFKFLKDDVLDIKAGLVGAGKVFVKEIKDRIQAGVSPANAAATVAKKGFDHPLVHKGFYRNSFDSKVVE